MKRIKFLLLILLSQCFVIVSVAQVVIKERITVNPSDSLSKKGYDLITAYSWDQYGNSVEEIIVPAGYQVAIEFSYRSASHISDLYFNGELIVPNVNNYFFYDQCFENDQSLNFNLYVHAGGGHWETDKIYVQKFGSDSEYRIFFEDYDDFDYNDLVISVTINESVEPLYVVQEYLSLYFGEKSQLSLNVSDACIELPANFTFSASIILGNEYGYLHDISTGLKGDTLVLSNEDCCSKTIEFIANEKVNWQEETV